MGKNRNIATAIITVILTVIIAMIIMLTTVECPKPSLGTAAQPVSQCFGWRHSPTAAPAAQGVAGGGFHFLPPPAEPFSKGSFGKELIPNEFVASSRNYSSGC